MILKEKNNKQILQYLKSPEQDLDEELRKGIRVVEAYNDHKEKNNNGCSQHTLHFAWVKFKILIWIQLFKIDNINRLLMYMIRMINYIKIFQLYVLLEI